MALSSVKRKTVSFFFQFGRRKITRSDQKKTLSVFDTHKISREKWKKNCLGNKISFKGNSSFDRKKKSFSLFQCSFRCISPATKKEKKNWTCWNLTLLIYYYVCRIFLIYSFSSPAGVFLLGRQENLLTYQHILSLLNLSSPLRSICSNILNDFAIQFQIKYGKGEFYCFQEVVDF